MLIYNVEGLDDVGAKTMKAEGRRVLAAYRVCAKYLRVRLCWWMPATVTLGLFCHPAVIDRYCEHPAHVAFADNLFRSVASERISIDFQSVEH